MAVRFMWGMQEGETRDLWQSNVSASDSYVLPNPVTGLFPASNSSKMAYFPGRYPSTKLVGMAAGNQTNDSDGEFTVDLGAVGDQTLVVGFAFRILPGTNASVYSGLMVDFLREGTATGSNISFGSLELSSSGELVVKTGGVIRLTGFFPNAGAHYYVEIKYRPHNTAGYIEVRFNGEVVFSLVGDTSNQSANLWVRRVMFRSRWRNNNNLICYRQYGDIYILDSSGTVNDFLGDVVVQRLYPSGNGSRSDMVGSDGNSSDNYALVNTPIPDQGRYVESNVVGARDLYAMDNLSGTSGDIVAVQSTIHASKQNEGYGSLRPVLKSGANEKLGTLRSVPSTVFTRLPDEIFETNPSNNTWTAAEVDSLEVGVEVGNV